MDTSRRVQFRLPPGPRGVPLAGHLFQFRRDPTGFLLRLAREYGDIAHFRLGSHSAFQLNHPDLIRDVLVTHSRNFHKTRNLVRARRVMGEGLITSEDELHRRQRRLAQPAFHRDRLPGYAAVMTDWAVRTGQRWRDGSTVDMYAEMLRLTLAIVGQTLFNADVESEAREIGRAMKLVFEYFNRLMLPFAGTLEKLPLPDRRRFEQARDLLDRTVFRVIEERRSSGKDHGDLLSMLLLATDDEVDGGRMSITQVRDEVMTAFLAGHETTGAALTWTWYLLATNPAAEAQMQRELQVVLNGRPATFDDLPRLEYTRMIWAESMRLYPPVWTLARRALDDYPVGDYVVPAGATVGLSQYVMHRDHRFYEHPERFEPMRWTPEETKKRPKFSYFPFGGGPRVCIGEGFAWTEGVLLLATLCQDWEARIVPGFEVQLQPLITLRPRGGMPMHLRRRASSPRAAVTAGCASA